MRARLLALLLGVAGALGDEAGPWHRRWTVGSAKDKAREDTRFVANDGSESVRVVKAVRPTSRCLGRVGRARSFVSHIGQDKFIYKTFFEKAKKVCSGVVMEVGANDGIFASNSLCACLRQPPPRQPQYAAAGWDHATRTHAHASYPTPRPYQGTRRTLTGTRCAWRRTRTCSANS